MLIGNARKRSDAIQLNQILQYLAGNMNKKGKGSASVIHTVHIRTYLNSEIKCKTSCALKKKNRQF